MYLLDTNVVAELRKAARADRHVVAWAASVPTGSLFLSVVTLLELEKGVLLVERRDPAQGALLRAWLDHQVLPAFEHRILDLDPKIALRCAALHIPNPRPDRDAMIAATALEHGLTIVTHNGGNFAGCGAEIISPFDSRPSSFATMSGPARQARVPA